MKFGTSDELIKKITEKCDGLIYISETDSPVEVYCGDDEKVNKEYKVSLNADEKKYKNKDIEITSHENFFDRITKEKSWHSAKQKLTVKKFEKLKELLEEEMTDIRQIRKGKVRIDIYVVGTYNDNTVLGIKTSSVET